MDIDKINSSLKVSDGKIEAREKEIVTLKESIKSKNDNTLSLEKTISDHEKNIKALEERNLTEKNKSEGLNRMIEGLKESTELKDTEISRQNQKIADLSKENSVPKVNSFLPPSSAMPQTDTVQVKNLELKLTEKEEVVENIKQNVKQKTAEIEGLKKQLENPRKEENFNVGSALLIDANLTTSGKGGMVLWSVVSFILGAVISGISAFMINKKKIKKGDEGLNEGLGLKIKSRRLQVGRTEDPQ